MEHLARTQGLSNFIERTPELANVVLELGSMRPRVRQHVGTYPLLATQLPVYVGPGCLLRCSLPKSRTSWRRDEVGRETRVQGSFGKSRE